MQTDDSTTPWWQAAVDRCLMPPEPRVRSAVQAGERLCLCDNRLRASDLPVIWEALASQAQATNVTPRLKDLAFRIDDEAVANATGEILQKTSMTVESLHLLVINVDAARAIAGRTSELSSLTTLSISGDPQQAGVKAIMRQLPRGVRELVMNLGDDADGVAYVVGDLFPESLRKLSIVQSDLTDFGAKAIASALSGRIAELKYLEMHDNWIRDNGVADLARALPSSIQHLGLAANQISREGARALLAELERLPDLYYLSLAENPIGIPEDVLNCITDPQTLQGLCVRRD